MLNVSAHMRLMDDARRFDRAGRWRSITRAAPAERVPRAGHVPRGRRALAVAAVVCAMTLAGPPTSIVPAAAASHQPSSQQPASQPSTMSQPAPATQRPSRPRAAQDEFVPVSDLPDSEKLPAAPFLIAAYTIVWLVLLLYVWSLWRRLTRVEQELKRAVADETRHV
jgi:CcmD family protein